MYDDLVRRLRSEAVYLPEKFSKNAELLDALMKSADAIEKLSQIETDLRVCRNELCLKCGQYQTKHLGSCNGCRWEES